VHGLRAIDSISLAEPSIFDHNAFCSLPVIFFGQRCRAVFLMTPLRDRLSRVNYLPVLPILRYHHGPGRYTGLIPPIAFGLGSNTILSMSRPARPVPLLSLPAYWVSLSNLKWFFVRMLESHSRRSFSSVYECVINHRFFLALPGNVFAFAVVARRLFFGTQQRDFFLWSERHFPPCSFHCPFHFGRPVCLYVIVFSYLLRRFLS